MTSHKGSKGEAKFMKFGLFYEWPNPTLRDWKGLFEEGLEEIQYSEEMGSH